MADDLVQKIMQDYPSFAFLLNDPEIGPLLLEAVNPDVGFDSATFQAKLLQTNWWKTNNAAQRQWFTLLNTDPAQAAKQRDERVAQVRQSMGQAGLSFSEDQIAGAADMSLRLGVDVASSTFRDWLGTWSIQTPGSAANITGRLKSITEGEYMLHSNDASLNWWASEIASGRQTEASFRESMARDAIGMYPAFADRITDGQTPATIFGGYRSTIANVLELGSPEQVDLLRDPRWQPVTGIVGADNKIRPMTLSEAAQLARKQPEFKGTAGGEARSASLAEMIDSNFGKVK